jgi:hypothetical protein
MAAAAYTLPVDRQSDWLVELERILEGWDAIPIAARDAVALVVESLIEDSDSSVDDVLHARALLAERQGRRLRPA